jgi:tRNA A37 methylthiotransferase MiaB
MKHSLFGCKVNKFYLNKWLNYFQARQFDVENGHLVATCVVTDRAKSKWVRQTKKMLKD